MDFGRWKSTKVAQRYISEAPATKYGHQSRLAFDDVTTPNPSLPASISRDTAQWNPSSSTSSTTPISTNETDKITKYTDHSVPEKVESDEDEDDDLQLLLNYIKKKKVNKKKRKRLETTAINDEPMKKRRKLQIDNNDECGDDDIDIDIDMKQKKKDINNYDGKQCGSH